MNETTQWRKAKQYNNPTLPLLAQTLLLILVSNIRHRVAKINTFAARLFPYFGGSVITQPVITRNDATKAHPSKQESIVSPSQFQTSLKAKLVRNYDQLIE